MKLFWIFVLGVAIGGAIIQYRFTGNLWSNKSKINDEEKIIRKITLPSESEGFYWKDGKWQIDIDLTGYMDKFYLKDGKWEVKQ